jgi:flavin-binding protein dodecin
MAVLKAIEVLVNSDKSCEDVTKKAAEHTSKSIKNICSVYISKQSASVDDSKISEFRVTVKITFEVKQYHSHSM